MRTFEIRKLPFFGHQLCPICKVKKLSSEAKNEFSREINMVCEGEHFFGNTISFALDDNREVKYLYYHLDSLNYYFFINFQIPITTFRVRDKAVTLSYPLNIDLSKLTLASFEKTAKEYAVFA